MTLMDDLTIAAIERSILEQTDQDAKIIHIKAVGGGCINQAHAIDLVDGRHFFVKSNVVQLAPMFASEAIGLAAIAGTETIRVPSVIGRGTSGQECFLILECIVSANRCRDFFERLGRGLAQLHQQGKGQQFGFDSDNYLGSSRQPNGPGHNWGDFWAEHRLGFQLNLARQNGLGGGELSKLGDRVLGRLNDLIGSIDEPPSLIHGDLWSGNYLADENGQPVLLDPAVYYASREAEFGMTTLFGGFDRRFYDAYEEIWPRLPGSDERIEIYRLYHLLNHLNLFGTSYLDACLEILRKYN